MYVQKSQYYYLLRYPVTYLLHNSVLYLFYVCNPIPTLPTFFCEIWTVQEISAR